MKLGPSILRNLVYFYESGAQDNVDEMLPRLRVCNLSGPGLGLLAGTLDSEAGV